MSMNGLCQSQSKILRHDKNKRPTTFGAMGDGEKNPSTSVQVGTSLSSVSFS